MSVICQVGRFPNDLPLSRVCFACPNNVSYVVAQWATWMSGGVAVPLCAAHPPSEMKYFIQDSDCDVRETNTVKSSSRVCLRKLVLK